MRPLARRDRVLLAGWLIGLLALGIVFGLVMPMRKRWVKVNGDISSLSQKVAEAAKMYQQAPALRAEIKDLRAAVQTLSRPDKEVGPALIREVDQATRELGLRLLSVRPGEPENLEGTRKYTVVFEVESDYGRLVKMLYQLGQPPRPLWVEGVEINSDRTAENEVRAKLSVAVYTLRPASEKSNDEG